MSSPGCLLETQVLSPRHWTNAGAGTQSIISAEAPGDSDGRRSLRATAVWEGVLDIWRKTAIFIHSRVDKGPSVPDTRVGDLWAREAPENKDGEGVLEDHSC